MFLNSMLEREDADKTSKLITATTLKHLSENGIQDAVISLSHRLSVLENSISSKIDRAQCMLILQSKANFSHVKKLVDQVNQKFQNDKKVTEQKITEQSKQNKKQIEKFREKLKGKKKDAKKSSQDKGHSIVRPQQLYLQSNQTMFSLIVDEISAIKQAQVLFQKNLQQRNKVTVSLNNQVCEKIQHLERQIQMNIKYNKQLAKHKMLNESAQSWSNSDEKSSRANQSSKIIFHKTEVNKLDRNGETEAYQISHIMRTIDSMQKQLASKINIKDILPLMKKNLQPAWQMIQQVKKYTEEAVESTKKILINQSQINQQLCTVCKLAWWHSFEEKEGLAIWNKQVANLVPENFICQKNSSDIIIVQQGTYLIKVLTPGDQIPQCIIVAGNEIQLIGQSLIKMEKNTVVQVPSSGGQMLFCIQKI